MYRACFKITSMSYFLFPLLLIICLFANAQTQAPKTKLATEYESVNKFINTMVSEHNFNKQDLLTLFSQVKFSVWTKSTIAPRKRPKKKPLTWQQYRALFLTKNRIDKGLAFWNKHQATLKKAQQKYNIPIEIMVAILGIETNYGSHQGKHKTLETLTKKAFNGYRRAKFYQKELKDFLLLTRHNNLAPLSISGSHAGAMGYAQFIASSYRHYAVDFDKDGKVDLFHSPADAIGSIANYFARHRWQKDGFITQAMITTPMVKKFAHTKPIKPHTLIKTWRARGLEIDSTVTNNIKADMIALNNGNSYEYWLTYPNFYAITRYNHNNYYAMAAYQLAQALHHEYYSQ